MEVLGNLLDITELDFFTIEDKGDTPGKPSASGHPKTPAAVSLKGLRLLLIEDDVDTVRVLKRLLERDGCSVITASCCEEGLKAGKEHTFDLVISDLGLPDGDGCSLMRALRANHNLNGIAVSGYGMSEDIRKCMDAGFSENLVKPILYDDLRQAIIRLSGRHAE